MIAVFIILGCLFSIVVLITLWVVFIPVVILMDTGTQRYEVWQRFTFIMTFKPQRENKFEMKIFGFRIPLESKAQPEKGRASAKKQKTSKMMKKSFESWFFLSKGSLDSFRLKRLIVDIDTDDIVLNAQLIPVGYWLSHGPVSLQSNFMGRVYVYAKIEARLYKMLWTFIRFLTKQ